MQAGYERERRFAAGCYAALVSERVVIFGATSAIAVEIARAYAARSARLFLVARNADRLAAVVAEFGPVCLGSISADLTDTRQSDELVQRARAALGELDVAVVAHGYLGDQLASERDLAEARRIVDTNLMSVIGLVIPLANYFEARRAGHLAVLGSVAGERGRPASRTPSCGPSTRAAPSPTCPGSGGGSWRWYAPSRTRCFAASARYRIDDCPGPPGAQGAFAVPRNRNFGDTPSSAP